MTKDTTVAIKVDGREPFQLYFDEDGKLHAIECREDHNFGRVERSLRAVLTYMEKETWGLVERIMSRRFEKSKD